MEINPESFFEAESLPRTSTLVLEMAREIRRLLDAGERKLSPELRDLCDRGTQLAVEKAEKRKREARRRGINLGRLVEDETQALWIEIVDSPEIRIEPGETRSGIVEVTHYRSGVKLSRAQAGQAKRLGSRKGWPDLHHIGISNGGQIQNWLVELKVQGGSLSKGQEKTIERLQGFGIDAWIRWGLADLCSTLLYVLCR